jgi:hypothetical protein
MDERRVRYRAARDGHECRKGDELDELSKLWGRRIFAAVHDRRDRASVGWTW